MKKDQFEQRIEAAFNSLEGMQRAQPQPFLLARINAVLQNKKPVRISLAEKWAAYISRPAIAFTLLAIVLFINITVLVTRSKNNNRETVTTTDSKDEYAYQNSVIFDIENP